MKTIYKYQLEVNDVQVLSLPFGFKILSLQTQNNVPCLWVEVDDTFHKENVSIHTFGTGHEINEYLEYIGTYQLNNGDLVFHVYKDN